MALYFKTELSKEAIENFILSSGDWKIEDTIGDDKIVIRNDKYDSSNNVYMIIKETEKIIYDVTGDENHEYNMVAGIHATGGLTYYEYNGYHTDLLKLFMKSETHFPDMYITIKMDKTYDKFTK